jgi:hypothetical protein
VTKRGKHGKEKLRLSTSLPSTLGIPYHILARPLNTLEIL